MQLSNCKPVFLKVADERGLVARAKFFLKKSSIGTQGTYARERIPT